MGRLASNGRDPVHRVSHVKGTSGRGGIGGCLVVTGGVVPRDGRHGAWEVG